MDVVYTWSKSYIRNVTLKRVNFSSTDADSSDTMSEVEDPVGAQVTGNAGDHAGNKTPSSSM